MCSGVVAAVALAGAVAGCAAPPDPLPALGAVELQADIAAGLSEEGVRTRGVSCPEDLPAEVGGSVRCEVEFAAADRVEAVVTVTSVGGGQLDYEITSRLTRAQVESRLVVVSAAQSAACESGLEAAVGEWTQCVVTKAGASSGRTVEVATVDGVRLELQTRPVLEQGRVEEELTRRLTDSEARPPDAVRCGAGLPGEVGSSVECIVTYDANPDPYVLTVTAIADDVIDFDYRPRWLPDDGDDGIDYCIGCPG